MNERFREIIESVKKARRHRSLSGQVVDMVAHKLFINTSPVDYYRFEFYKEDRTWEEKSRYVGKRGSRYYPYESNLIKYVPVLDDKYLFKALLAGFGLPQPRLIGTVGKTHEISTADRFYEFLCRIECDIVVKPVSESCGRDVLVLDVHEGAFRSGGTLYSNETLWEHVRRHPDGCLVEEKVRQRRDLASIYPHSLNTFRIVTIRTDDGVWHAGRCSLRFGRGGSRIDNSSAGGVSVWIDQNGKSAHAFDCRHMKSISHHPDTGAPLVGIKLEGFRDVVELALKASTKFGFLGTIGWDIACSEDGAVIIEGNPFWDCWFGQIGPRGGIISPEVAKGLRKRGPFSTWDRTRIHPRFDRFRIKA